MSKFIYSMIDWYEHNHRSFPWRVNPNSSKKPNTYHIWLAEIMLQQTNTTTVKPYFRQFIKRWKNIKEISKAPIEEIRKEWAGLGYYSRATNLKKCAEAVVEQYNGRFPKTKNELIKLAGIGDYTSSAIAAIAFNEKTAVVDGNIERVVSRYCAIEEQRPALTKKCKEFLQKEIDKTKNINAGDLAQAMMDLGATICTPKNPKCDICVLKKLCKARKLAEVEKFPRKSKKARLPTRKGAAFVIRRETDGAVWLIKRKEKGMLANMTSVPTTDWSAKKNGEIGKSAVPFKSEWKKCGVVRHTFTHFHLELEVYETYLHEVHETKLRKNKKIEKGYWVMPKHIEKEALPSLMRKVINQAGANIVWR